MSAFVCYSDVWVLLEEKSVNDQTQPANDVSSDYELVGGWIMRKFLYLFLRRAVF